MIKKPILFYVVTVTLAAHSPYSVAGDVDLLHRLDGARTSANNLIGSLGKQLKYEMATNGPVAAIGVCRNLAPEMTNTLSQQTGWRVTRVSEQPRNAMTGRADAWEQGVLMDFKRQLENGLPEKPVEYFEVVDEPFGKSFRYMQALDTKSICLACHGSASQIPDEVKARINDFYPFDSARGFELGALRGAVSIKQPINDPIRKYDKK